MVKPPFKKPVVVAGFSALPCRSVIVAVNQRRALNAMRVYKVHGEEQPAGVSSMLKLNSSAGAASHEGNPFFLDKGIQRLGNAPCPPIVIAININEIAGWIDAQRAAFRE